MPVFVEIAAVLMDLEAELRRLGQWDAEPPAAAALASTEPFCVDTMTLAQWLQFVFIPRTYALIEEQRLPPGRCAIRAIAEEYFRDSRLDAAALLQHIGKLDALIDGAGGSRR